MQSANAVYDAVSGTSGQLNVIHRRLTPLPGPFPGLSEGTQFWVHKQTGHK